MYTFQVEAQMVIAFIDVEVKLDLRPQFEQNGKTLIGTNSHQDGVE